MHCHRVINVIEQMRDRKLQLRDENDLQGIAINRVGINRKTNVVLGSTGPEIAECFLGRDKRYPEVSKATNYQNPYPFYVGGSLEEHKHNGTIWQVATIQEICWHARSYSKTHIGIACIGDFRVEEPPRRMWESTVHLCTLLCRLYSWDPFKAIRAHGELTGAHDGSKAKGQSGSCPGDLFDMNVFRYDVEQALRSRAIADLNDLGVVRS
jgi:hypothetical protein